jgi:GMP synthase (glutamine-hydrolysing)
VQYHPEFALHDVAATLQRYGDRLIDDGHFATAEELASHIDVITALHANPGLRHLAWRFGLDDDLLDSRTRLTEIANWITYAVLPQKSRRSRA